MLPLPSWAEDTIVLVFTSFKDISIKVQKFTDYYLYSYTSADEEDVSEWQLL